MTATRRHFLGGIAAAGGVLALSRASWAQERPLLRFGVVSDVHIGGNPRSPQHLEAALRLIRSKRADAVLCTGDIAHSGLIGELEKFAEVWHSVFPGGRGADGGKVELMIATGNHDVDAWAGRWNRFSEEQMLTRRFCYRDNPAKVWGRLFGQKWELVWRKTVKGCTFIGSQWSSLRPPVEETVPRIARSLDASKPFFYCQHAHPADTCYGPGVRKQGLTDGGEATRALSGFPNAVAFSGHSHCPLTDERSVWQGTFTSIGAGCTCAAGLDFGYDNATAPWHPSNKAKTMRRLEPDASVGGSFEIVDVYADRLVVHRWSPQFEEPLGPAWVVPLPAVPDGPFDFKRRARAGQGPLFAPGARADAAFCRDGHPEAGVSFAGKPVVAVTFPHAEASGGRRVYDYVVAAADGAGPLAEMRILAPGFALPASRADLPGVCLFRPDALPSGTPVSFSVVPRDCFGVAGKPIFSDPIEIQSLPRTTGQERPGGADSAICAR